MSERGERFGFLFGIVCVYMSVYLLACIALWAKKRSICIDFYRSLSNDSFQSMMLHYRSYPLAYLYPVFAWKPFIPEPSFEVRGICSESA